MVLRASFWTDKIEAAALKWRTCIIYLDVDEGNTYHPEYCREYMLLVKVFTFYKLVELNHMLIITASCYIQMNNN